MMARVFLYACSILLVLCAANPNRASAYCLWQGATLWQPGTTINVYLNTNITDICLGNGDGSSDCTSFTELERTVRGAIDEFNDVAAANITLRYAGSTSASVHGTIDGAIHIYATESGEGVAAGDNGDDSDPDTYTDWGRVSLNDDYTFSSYLSSASVWPLHGVLLHEILHALGFGHIEGLGAHDCNQSNRASAVRVTNFAGQHLYKEDILGLQTYYGVRPSIAGRRKTTNISSWSSASIDSEADDSQARFGASSGDFTGLATFPRNYGTRRIRNIGGGNYLGDFTADSWYHSSSAGRGFEAFVAYGTSYDNASGDQDLRLRVSTNGGTTWGGEVQFTSSTTHSPGVAAAWDPATDRYIVIWRAPDQSGKYRIWDPDASNPIAAGKSLTWPGSTPLRSADSFSIACGQTSVVGSNNCLLTWTSTDWSRFFYWVTGHVECTPIIGGTDCTFVFNDADVYADPTVVYGEASVAYTSNSSWPWVLAFHQGIYYAMTKRKATSGGWGSLYYHYTSGYTISPTVGSQLFFCFPISCSPETSLYYRN